MSQTGRPLPPLTPQSVGRWFHEPVGKWSTDRARLAHDVTKNLSKLNKLSKLADGLRREQLHLEITLHWHCLSEAEKVSVLESVGTKEAQLVESHPVDSIPSAWPETTPELAAYFDQKSPVGHWLEHTAAFMKPADASRLLEACSTDAKQKLTAPFSAATDSQFKETVKQRSADLRMTLPLDHMYDYTGFWFGNDRKVGELPKGVAENLKVCIVGAGPAGIVAADGLNRLGVKPIILEQADKIGGRIASEKWRRNDGSMSPTPLHPGGMRFHTTNGNVYWSIAKHYGLEHVPFPNPNSVDTSYIIGNDVYEAKAGERPNNPQMQKVAQDILRVMTEPLLSPIREARDAADTATFRELCDAAKKKFDSHTFRSGLQTLLKENGIEWDKKDWQTFGATGIGVGGYEGYMSTGFLEEFRFLVDERLEDHVALVGGADAPLYSMIKDDKGLPEGMKSLDEQQAIKLGIEVIGIKKRGGQYHVTSRDKNTNEITTQAFDELIFAGGPKEAVRLGLTGPQEGSQDLMTSEAANAMEQANVVGATKMAIKVAKDLFLRNDLPGNIQGSKLFQQSYVLPPLEGSDNAVIYPSYTLGTNAVKVAGMTGEEQLNNYIKVLRDIASQRPDDPGHQKLKNLADVVEQSKDKISYTHWGLEKHQYGAFKMDGPNQLDNTRTLFRMLLEMDESAIFVNEENTAEGGFASGAVAAAINGLQKMIVRLGGTIPPNSPYYQQVL